MKLSEAIDLGRTIMRPEVHVFTHEDSGCALQMALRAAGKKYSYTNARKVWPWLEQTRTYPCGCRSWFKQQWTSTVIIHLFDEHVIVNQDWTLDQLIDWVRSVEPAEDVPSSDGALATKDAHAEVC